MNFKDKKITVMGLGLHGGSEGLIRYLVSKGAKVKVSDAKPRENLIPTINRLADLDIAYRLDGHHWDHFQDADMIFINQAVKPGSLWRKKIIKSGIPTFTETNLFVENCPAPIIGITGTNGKSTTATLVYQILKANFKNSDKKVFFGGNIGMSLLNHLDEIKESDLVVMEFSSFQLNDFHLIKKSPHVAVILNITPDHLDYHKDFNSYVEAKKNISKFQDESDFAVLNYDQNRVKNISAEIKSRAIYFSMEKSLKNGVFIKDDGVVYKWRGNYQKVIQISEIPLLGKHNLQNVLAAVASGVIYKVKPEIQKEVIQKFRSLSHRIEFVKERDGVKYYDDSKATTPESTIAALSSFPEPVILLAGGSEKYAKFKRMSQEIIKSCRVVILFGQTKKRIYGSILKRIDKIKEKKLSRENIFLVTDLKEAVVKAKSLASSGEVVLLSPGCASFDQFANFEERGEKFKKIIYEIQK